MPRRADLDPVEIPSLLPHITLVGVEYDPFRLYYRLIGTHITDAVGRDSTGRYFDEVYEGGMLEDMVRRFSTAVHAKRPARFLARAVYAGKDYRHYEAVHLPLSEDGETVNMIFAGAESSTRVDRRQPLPSDGPFRHIFSVTDRRGSVYADQRTDAVATSGRGTRRGSTA